MKKLASFKPRLFYLVTTGQKKEKVMATLSVVCSPNFYGAHCELFCRPPTARHQCDHVTGTLKCAKGWIGENCGINGKE